MGATFLYHLLSRNHVYITNKKIRLNDSTAKPADNYRTGSPLCF